MDRRILTSPNLWRNPSIWRRHLVAFAAISSISVLSAAVFPSVVVAEDAFALKPLALTQVGLNEKKSDKKNNALDKFIMQGLQQLSPVKEANKAADSEPVQIAQSSRDIGSMNVRIGQLEEQVRSLTGQVEGLQFQMTQLQTLLERMQEDNEFRFQALEGGSLGKINAAPQSGGATPLEGVPQNLDLNAPLDLGSDATSLAPGAEGALVLGAEQGLSSSIGLPVGQLGGEHLDGFGSQDSLLTDADAAAQYQAGYDAVIRGDYEFAEDQFRQFVALFPEHPNAPDATNWLGEALLQRGLYDDAADILVTGFESYSESVRAPDILFKLGMALAGSGEHDTACLTFAEVLRRYPNVPNIFKVRLGEESAKSQC